MRRAGCGVAAAAWMALLATALPAAGPAMAQDSWAAVAIVRGNTVYDTAALVDFAAGHVEQAEGQVTLPALAGAVEQLYREDGYFLATVRAFQDPVTGQPRLDIDEGGVDRLELRGVPDRIGQRIADYLRPVLTGAPLRMRDFERALMLAGDLSGVQLRSEFTTDAATGRRLLVVHATARSHRFIALADNSPRQQAVNGYLSGEAYSTLQPGDMLRVTVGATAATDEDRSGFNVAGFYRMPVGTAGTYAEFFASNTLHGRDLSGGLADARHQRGTNAIALVGHPVLRDIHQFLYLAAEYDIAEVDFGDPAIRRERSQAVRLSAVYSHVDDSYGSFRAIATVSAGRTDSSWNAFVDPDFWHLRGAAGLLLPLGPQEEGLALRLHGYAQWSPATLPETERFYLGDRERLRGYLAGTLTGDSGAIGTIDASRQIALDGPVARALVPSVFLDAGVVARNRDFDVVPARRATSPIGDSSKALASTGIGLRAYMAEGFVLSGWVALPLVDDGRDTRYGPAAYLRLTKSW
ncbi:ShlB/FhaC/HecB family hemolysin secretion/activation protein [Roseomonas stagni]|uniref:ShlB/FhaC/HecB family hemolysin secretion/activation protein n=1 Tax=Falsiroseomonas algicola TaxID=2716930 RepID=A0A6M1LSX6_9PROT|nr:ShlB/FhaC/HecB family hemolysin secretion/activation protein [Falsiroseomonas algicola]NGM23511.1 ShlB/FhaC/HecB family hemolysin secretion/activation protein [Falsiroseomonas algicola]